MMPMLNEKIVGTNGKALKFEKLTQIKLDDISFDKFVNEIIEVKGPIDWNRLYLAQNDAISLLKIFNQKQKTEDDMWKG